MNLKQTPPKDAMNRYLREKKTHVSKKTIHNYTATIGAFTDWLENQEIRDMRKVDSELINQYKHYRLKNVKPITARHDMWTVRDFIHTCETLQCVPVGTHELVQPPKVKDEDKICDTILTREEATEILKHLNKFEYATSRHVIVLLLWKCGMRVGGLRAIDVDDFDRERPALEIRHRPSSQTPLKGKEKSERDVLINKEVTEVVDDYIKHERPDSSDDYGRNPLIATRHGRMSRTTITRQVYAATSPCFYTAECPFDEMPNPDDCEATEWNKGHECPGSVSPHALRRGYVTAARNAGQTKEITGERVNMTGKILDKHYDKGTHGEKAERRKGFLKDI